MNNLLPPFPNFSLNTPNSWIMYARVMTTIRLLTDCMAVLTILSGVCELICETCSDLRAPCSNTTNFSCFLGLNDGSMIVGAYVYDLVDIGILGLVVVVIDIYFRLYQHFLIFNSNNLISKIPLFLVIFLVLLGTWEPFYWLVPFFVDTNDPYVFFIFTNLYVYGYLLGTLIFNTYYAVVFAYCLCRRSNSTKFGFELRLIASKSIFHAMLRLVLIVFNHQIDPNGSNVLHKHVQ